MSVEPQENQNTKVLIVDSDKFLVGMYSVKLESKGFAIDSSLSSLDALKKLREGKVYDIILIEILMQTMNGIELLKNIREENLCPKATVIILTNETQPSQIEEAKKFKIDGYIIKASSVPSEVLDEVVKIHNAHSKI